MTAKARVAKKAIELLAKKREGFHHSVLVQRLKAALPGMPVNTIRGSVVGLVEFKPDEVFKPAKGLFRHAMYREGTDSSNIVPTLPRGSTNREEAFYPAFAEYLVGDLEECSKCIPLGGCAFRDKWARQT